MQIFTKKRDPSTKLNASYSKLEARSPLFLSEITGQ